LRIRIHYLGTYLDPAFLKVFDPDLEVQNATLNEKIFYQENQINNIKYSSGSSSQKVTVPTVPASQHCIFGNQ
jgi:hypothetical protein